MGAYIGAVSRDHSLCFSGSVQETHACFRDGEQATCRQWPGYLSVPEYMYSFFVMIVIDIDTVLNSVIVHQ